MLAAIDRFDLLAEERFNRARAIAASRKAFIRLLDAALGAQPPAYWAARFDEHDVWWVQVEGSAGTPPLRALEAPIRFDGTDRGVTSEPLQCGEHTEALLRELGYDKLAIHAVMSSPR